MIWPRSSGVLLHITSLATPHGIGDLGPSARAFADWLALGKQSVWQMLPLTPTGYGDSPYQALSAFAGNPLLISLDDLVTDGLLDAADIAGPPSFPHAVVDYEAVKAWKLPLLRKAATRLRASLLDASPLRPDYDAFVNDSSAWLSKYALFAALKHLHRERAWTQWEPRWRSFDPDTLRNAQHETGDGFLADDIAFEIFAQFLFDRQWRALRKYCRERNIRLMGDLPIYVAHDSADVWTHPELFHLNRDGSAKFVAGVPPDYFSATGQLWGNPIYCWEEHQSTGFAWWTARMRHMLSQFDLIRVDHFRGFEAYWEVPGGDKTAQRGQWVKAPGMELFETLERELGDLPVLAENLGVITPEVEALRTRFQLPGMAILQFAFGTDPQAPYFKPHNYTHDRVAYTGTHDNDTVIGWWQRNQPSATQSLAEIEAERAFAKIYLHMQRGDNGAPEDAVNWVFIRTLMASVASLVIFPMQDVLGLGTEARMNYPGTSSGNWRWRLSSPADQLRPADAARLAHLAVTYER